MSTAKQKSAARRNIKRATTATAERRRHGARPSQSRHPLSSRETRELPGSAFAFPEQRKEPLTDAKHVRNAIARFNQVEDVTDADRETAWKRIQSAAKKFDVDVSEKSWRELSVRR